MSGTSESMSTKGASAGSSFSDAVKGAFHGAEDLRKGINNFADNAIQPQAARDSEAGVAAQHKHETTTGGTGFSKDAELLGSKVADSASGGKKA